jgi:hypothetical protein
MPIIYEYRCDKCDLTLPTGWGGCMYVMSDAGYRVTCPHPEEKATIIDVLGENAPTELVHERTGFNSDCLCEDCLSQFSLDLERDNRVCLICKSGNVHAVSELINESCPKR